MDKLTPGELNHLCKEAISAARKAGDLIMEYYGKAVEKKQKKSGTSDYSSIVTEVDIKSEKLILDTLQPAIEDYDLGLLAEESTDDSSRFSKKYFWCIDPLDGTKPFAEKGVGFSVSISLIDVNGIPNLGVVYDPVKQNLYYAIKGFGAFRNENPWTGMESNSNKLNFFYTKSLSKNKKFADILIGLERIGESLGLAGVNKVLNGGSVMNAIWAAENAPGCFFSFPKKNDGGGCIWDYAATSCIFNELGFSNTDIFGDSLDLNNRKTTFMNKKGVLYTSHPRIKEGAIQLYKMLLD